MRTRRRRSICKHASAAQGTPPRARPVIVAPSQMKKGPEAVLLGPIPQDAQAVSLRLRPTLCRRPQSFFRRTRLMIAFRVTSASLRLPPQGAGRTLLAWGRAAS